MITPRLCACGCGMPMPEREPGTFGRPALYIAPSHRRRAYKRTHPRVPIELIPAPIKRRLRRRRKAAARRRGTDD